MSMTKLIAITFVFILCLQTGYKHWRKTHNEYLLVCMHAGRMKDDCEND